MVADGNAFERRYTMSGKTNQNPMLARIMRITDHREFMIAYIIVLAVIAMAYAIPEFMSRQNTSAILLALADQSIIAVGMTLLMVSGGFDMSVGSTMALSGATTAIWLTLGLPVPVAIILGLGVGLLIGTINGLVIAKVGINPFITTLGMMSLARGMLMVVSNGKNISGLPDSFTAIGQGDLFGIQYPIIISIVLVAVGDFLLRRSRFFRQNYYMGANEKAAVLSGINAKRMKVFNYAVTGLLAALAGIIITARLGSASTSAGKGLELRVISAVIIGGASLQGGEGTVLGSFFGSLLMAIIVSSLTILGVDVYWNTLVIGATLLLAVMIDTLAKKRMA